MNVALIFVVFSLLLLQGSADAQSLCRPCRNAAQEELKKCLEAAISQVVSENTECTSGGL